MMFLTSNGDFVLLILEPNVRGLQTPSCGGYKSSAATELIQICIFLNSSSSAGYLFERDWLIDWCIC